MAAAESPEDGHRTVVEAEREDTLDTQRRVDARTPGFATAVDLEQEPGARPDDALAEVVARTPGAHARSIGGLGQFSALSLRGSSSQQVAVFLDGVPLGSSFAGLVDLSDFPLDGIGRLEVYRGHIPVAFGGSALGGALNLRSRVGWGSPGARLRAGYGSFGARQVGADIVAPLREGLQLGARASYAGTQGAYPYYDNGGTAANTGDDRTLARLNNDFDRTLAQLRLDGESGDVRWNVQQWVIGKWQGIPGPVGAPARDARLNTVASRTIAGVERFAFGKPGGRIAWVLGAGVQRRRFIDPAAELGVNVDDQRTTALDAYVSPRWRIPLWRGAYLGLVGDVRPEWVQVRERVPEATQSGNATRARAGVGAGLELEQFLAKSRIQLVPVLRIDGVASRFAVPAGDGEVEDTGRNDVAFGFTPRFGARFRLTDFLQLRGSAGRYFRPPTLLELFGDRGYIVGNEGLRPERGTAVDGGVVFDFNRERLDVYATAAGFGVWSEDLIQWISAGLVTRPENIAAARVRGLETSLQFEPKRRGFRAAAHYTFLDTADRGDDPTFRDRPLPGRPRHDVFGRATAGWEWRMRGVPVEPRILYTVEFIAGTFLDPSGRFELPPRSLQGVGAELHLDRRVHIAVEVRNLLDVRTAAVLFPIAGARPTPLPVSDFIGFPLPGRSLWANLVLDFG